MPEPLAKNNDFMFCITALGYGPVSLVVTIKDNPGYVLVAVRAEAYIMPWENFENDSSLRLLSIVDLGLPDNRCNDGKVDARGRLWFGKEIVFLPCVIDIQNFDM